MNYTESKLKPMKQADLLEIAAANEIEADENMSKKDIIALILEKGCLMPDKNSAGDKTEKAAEFSKEQILTSNWYSHRRDILNTLLDENKTYSHAAVDELIKNFMKSEVK